MANPFTRPESKEYTPKSSEHAQEARREENLTAGIDASSILQSVEGEEGVEAGVGHVKENVGESIGEHRQGTAGKFQQFQKQLTDEEANALKKKLLTAPPTKEQMIHQIRAQVTREIIQLGLVAKRYEKKGSFKELNEVVRQIRELRGILEQLFRATAEMLKNIWLKVVHGLT